jgi:pyruvate/2-oxoglutarate dehydrogenase complex dihydrolipoamide acyltransferase (E2) component
MWWFDTPGSPYVNANVAIDMTAAQAYLAALNAQDGPRVSLQHLLCGAVGRTLGEFPMARARILGHHIVPEDRVGVAMPVNLLGHAEGARRELGLVVVEDAQQRDLRSMAETTRETVGNERAGKTDNAFFKTMLRVVEQADGPAMFAALDAFERARRSRRVDARLRRFAPITTGLTNPGAAISELDGVLVRGASVQIPMKLVHVATLWGITPIQQEVIPVDGQPAVRPMLPVLLTFDHRLMDGVYAGRVLKRFAAILLDPEPVFGPAGRRTAG